MKALVFYKYRIYLEDWVKACRYLVVEAVKGKGR